jgi:DNA polymerase III sliding clamp (beta) subunit (PCNA family)
MVIPAAASLGGRVTCGRTDLLAALAAAGKVAADKGVQGVKLTAELGTLTVHAENPDKGTASIPLPCSGCDGKALAIGVNAVYLRDALATFDGTDVTLEYAGELDPMILRPAGVKSTLCVAMPMRI